jgi:hypothetical protein
MSPAVLLSLTIATCYGCGFHMLFGRRIWQWPLFWVVAIAGFLAGYVIGIAIGLDAIRVGSIPLLAATLASFGALGLAWYFSAPYAVRAGEQRGGNREQGTDGR